jgi:hypothetical protein
VEQTYQAAALEEVRGEYGNYFDALEQHPRLLVGMEVPAVGPGKTGNETLRDAKDAEDWQSAVKHLLVQEVRSRAGRQMDEQGDFLATVHASIELFQKNPDLMPTTKGFDKELATRFTKLAEPYEVRVEEKFQGYSIPVQPIIDQLRSQLVSERAAAAPVAAAAAGAPSSPAKTPAATKPPADPPQAGIQSKAGSGADGGEDFSTLWGTIGLPNLQI